MWLPFEAKMTTLGSVEVSPGSEVAAEARDAWKRLLLRSDVAVLASDVVVLGSRLRCSEAD